jgi:hypothetical protein
MEIFLLGNNYSSKENSKNFAKKPFAKDASNILACRGLPTAAVRIMAQFYL